MHALVLTSDEVEDFIRDGFTVVRGAFSKELAAQCREEIWARVEDLAPRRDEPSTWSQPEIRVPCPEGPLFAEVGTSPSLWDAYDQLIGPGRWPRRQGVGGAVVIRFPSEESVHIGGDGWQIESNYPVNGVQWSDVHSTTRALLTLFLFSDVTIDDAPTALLTGSHVDAAQLLATMLDGMAWAEVRPRLPATTFERPNAFAVGEAGDVYLVHPFLAHRSTWPHRGPNVRFVAQPSVWLHTPYALTDRDSAGAVERAIIDAVSV